MVTQAVRGKKASLSLSELTWGAEKPLRGWVCLDLCGKELLTNLLQYLSAGFAVWPQSGSQVQDSSDFPRSSS
jgi:hypothetical protein